MKRVVIASCALYGMVLIATHYERKQTMNQTSFFWITELQKKAQLEPRGSLQVKDKQGRALMLNWHLLATQSAAFMPCMNEIADLAAHAFTEVEYAFLKAYPQAVKTERLYQHLAPLFEKEMDEVDWKQVKKNIYDIIHRLYTSTDWSKFGIDDVYIFVTAREPNANRLTGFITFFIRPSYPFGTCKVTAMGVSEDEQGRGIGKLLMGSIFKIVPEVTRVFLSTRVTNARALAAYHTWGFSEDRHPIQETGHVFNPEYWKFLEYGEGQGELEKGV